MFRNRSRSKKAVSDGWDSTVLVMTTQSAYMERVRQLSERDLNERINLPTVRSIGPILKERSWHRYLMINHVTYPIIPSIPGKPCDFVATPMDWLEMTRPGPMVTWSVNSKPIWFRQLISSSIMVIGEPSRNLPLKNPEPYETFCWFNESKHKLYMKTNSSPPTTLLVVLWLVFVGTYALSAPTQVFELWKIIWAVHASGGATEELAHLPLSIWVMSEEGTCWNLLHRLPSAAITYKM